MKDGDRCGLAVFCSEPGTLTVVKENSDKCLVMTDRGIEKERIPFSQDYIYLKVVCDFMTDDALFYYSLDGKKYKSAGSEFTMREGKWIGAKIGLVAAEPAGKANRGWIDADWFRVTK